MTDPKPRTDADLGRTLADFSVPSEPGNERLAMETVAESARGLGFSGENLERLKTAVGEATMNAMEHGTSWCASPTGGVARRRPTMGTRRISRPSWRAFKRPGAGVFSSSRAW